MALDPKQRRDLSARANGLKAVVTVGGGAPAEGVIDHVRRALASRALLKVRVDTRDGDECRATAEALAAGTGSELVQVVGRVATLYRAGPGGDVGGGQPAPDGHTWKR